MPPPYKPVGKCIYCGKIPNENEPALSAEHIVPACLRGQFLLPNASCKDCSTITGKFEQECVESFFGQARPHLGLYRNQSNIRLRVETTLTNHGRLEKRKLPIHDHPGCFVLPRFPKAAFYTGKRHQFEGRAVLYPLNNFYENVAKLAEAEFHLFEIEVNAFIRQIAKIAHSFLCAEIGVDSFTPTLLPTILQGDISHADILIGSDRKLTIGEHKNQMHTLSLSVHTHGGIQRYIVRLRLMQEAKVPTYHVVTGRRFLSESEMKALANGETVKWHL